MSAAAHNYCQSFILPRSWEDDGEEVGDCHRHEDHVGGRAHVLLAQHDYNQDVGEEGDGELQVGSYEQQSSSLGLSVDN